MRTFVHTDIGTREKQVSLALTKTLAPVLPQLTAPGAILAADQPMPLPGWTEEPPPKGVAPSRYRLYRRPEGADRRPRVMPSVADRAAVHAAVILQKALESKLPAKAGFP